jgi:hypothetical protein
MVLKSLSKGVEDFVFLVVLQVNHVIVVVIDAVHDVVTQDEVLQQNLESSVVSYLCGDVERFAHSAVSLVVNDVQGFCSSTESFAACATEEFEAIWQV